MSATLTVQECTGAPARSRAGASDSEFCFGLADFERVRRLIFQRAGIRLGAGRQAAIYSRLARRLRETGHPSFGSYLRWLEQSGGLAAAVEWREFVSCLTTDAPAFFRDAHHFDALAVQIASRAEEEPRIWCCAASTGEEPYSIAITVAEAMGGVHRARIVATDIDTRLLAIATRGVYAADSPGLSSERLHEHFLRGRGLEAGLARVKPQLARSIEFRRADLADAHGPPGERFDFVFCRDVLSAFEAARRRHALERIHAAMHSGGQLFVGHAEDLGGATDLFRLRAKSIYERI